ncbi:MAG TPA: 5-formyltetrahydrofolate cyclo-ligase [Proteobacteria bacterium]|nr:5-formyltetrahydrofolate cyclo-ligase family protein [bacterium BMS3Abin14]HDL52462.1 5-formyltetrahydrofolate cyclo-ligase [Pseudomonadota bacterium]
MSKYLIEKKERVRERMKKIRQGLSHSQIRRGSQAVAGKALSRDDVRSADLFCTYASVGGEIETDEIILSLIEEGKTVAVPDWEGWRTGSGLRIIQINGARDLLTDQRIVPQPRIRMDRIIPVERVDIFFVPGLAFDLSGNRIGMGGGYFDRLLALASPSSIMLGLAHDFQVIENLPTGDRDIPVNHVITPRRVENRQDFHKIEEVQNR